MTYPSSPEGLIVPRQRDGHRRRFSEADKRRILKEAARLESTPAGVARRFGIALRILRRWKQEQSPARVPEFITVQVTDLDAPKIEGHAS